MAETFFRRCAVILEILTARLLRATIVRARFDFIDEILQDHEMNTLKDLYFHELKDLYSAEKQIIKALPKMVKAATNDKLASGFQEHLEQTKGHAERLEKILSRHSQTTRAQNAKGWRAFSLREVK